MEIGTRAGAAIKAEKRDVVLAGTDKGYSQIASIDDVDLTVLPKKLTARDGRKREHNLRKEIDDELRRRKEEEDPRDHGDLEIPDPPEIDYEFVPKEVIYQDSRKGELPIRKQIDEQEFEDDRDRELTAYVANLARRDLGPVAWGRAFKSYTRLLGVEEGVGKTNQHTRASASFAEAAKEAGVSERTAYNRVNLAADLEEYPNIANMVDNKELPQPVACEGRQKRTAGLGAGCKLCILDLARAGVAPGWQTAMSEDCGISTLISASGLQGGDFAKNKVCARPGSGLWSTELSPLGRPSGRDI